MKDALTKEHGDVNEEDSLWQSLHDYLHVCVRACTWAHMHTYTKYKMFNIPREGS